MQAFISSIKAVYKSFCGQAKVHRTSHEVSRNCFVPEDLKYWDNSRWTELLREDVKEFSRACKLLREYMMSAPLPMDGRESILSLSGVSFVEANLYGVDLVRVNLYKADLHGTCLVEADLRDARLMDANLCGAHLRGAKLCMANLCMANLCGAHLRGANLRKADLLAADLREVDMYETDLREAYLENADLRKADLIRVDLRGANLRKADLRGADLDGIFFDEETCLVGVNLLGAINVPNKFVCQKDWQEKEEEMIRN